MKMKAIAGLILIAAIVIVAMFAGCIEEEKISASDEINMSSSLMNSGANRVEKIDLEAGAYSDAKVKLTASKLDYEEALKILNNATTDYDEEKKIIETNIIICSYSLDSIATLQNLTICLEHLEKAAAYMEGEDIASSRSELKLAKDALNDLSLFISTAKEKCFSIDIETVPVESKSAILEDRISIEQSERMVSQFGEMISGMYSFLDGMEHMLKAIDYMEKEEWHSAELEFGKCSPDFSISKDTFINLKNSEFTEISVPAIEMSSLLSKMLEDLPHFEAGCMYASKGNFRKAEEEFNKISEY